jgi:hypothetical protein
MTSFPFGARRVIVEKLAVTAFGEFKTMETGLELAERSPDQLSKT